MGERVSLAAFESLQARWEAAEARAERLEEVLRELLESKHAVIQLEHFIPSNLEGGPPDWFLRLKEAHQRHFAALSTAKEELDG